MSNNLRDLYKKKGNKLSKEIQTSKNEAKGSIGDLVLNKSKLSNISSDISFKLKRLQHKFNIEDGLEVKYNSNNKNNKNQILINILSLGINLQRINGKPIVDINKFLSSFNSVYNSSISIDLFNKCIYEIQKKGLIYSFSNNELIFEPLSKSIEISLILRLVGAEGKLELKTIKKSLTTWSDNKIGAVVDKLELEGILIKDGDKFWFPQLK